MQVISFMNMKGGVGKTTLAVNVAYVLATQHNKKVLIIDVDPQFNASQYLLGGAGYLKHIQSKKTVLDIFMPKRSNAIDTTTGSAKTINNSKMTLNECTENIFLKPGGSARLDLIPSTLNLVEVQTARRQTENKLKGFVAEKATHYDCVIIDCPPTISVFAEAAMLASDKYIVPIKPDPLSVLGLPLLEQYIADFTEDSGISLSPIGLVFVNVRGNAPNAMKAVMSDLRASRKTGVFPAHLSEATCVAESVASALPIHLFAKSPARVKMQILDITTEFVKRTKV